MHQQMDDDAFRTRKMYGTFPDSACQTTGLLMQERYDVLRGLDPSQAQRELTLDEADRLAMAFESLGHVCASNSCVNGFWDRVNVPEKVALVASEAIEALEALREPTLKVSEKTPPHSNFAEELADVIIRVMDLDAILNLELATIITRKLSVNAKRPRQHGGKRF